MKKILADVVEIYQAFDSRDVSLIICGFNLAVLIVVMLK